MKHLCFLLLFLSLPTLLLSQQKNAAPAQPPLTAAQLAATNPRTPKEFFARARQLSDLEAAGIPFHLKATYVVKDDTKFTGNGTFEEWWQSKDVWRKEATLGSYKWVQIENETKPALYTSSPCIPLRLRQVVDAVEIRIDPNIGTRGDWRLRHKKIRGADLTVLTPRHSRKSPGGLRTGYYFTPEGMLQIRQAAGTTTVYNNVQLFRALLIPRSVVVGIGQGHFIDISIDKLAPLSPASDTASTLTAVPAGVATARDYSGLLKGALPPKVMYAPIAILPPEDRRPGLRAMVSVCATVDDEGHVQGAYVGNSADSSLDAAALHAVEQYRFKPAMLDGKPVAFKLAVEIAFRTWP